MHSDNVSKKLLTLVYGILLAECTIENTNTTTLSSKIQYVCSIKCL